MPTEQLLYACTDPNAKGGNRIADNLVINEESGRRKGEPDSFVYGAPTTNKNQDGPRRRVKKGGIENGVVPLTDKAQGSRNAGGLL